MSKSKILSLLLALTLIFSVLPVSAFAEEPDTRTETGVVNAIDAITNGGLTFADGGDASCTCTAFCDDANCVICNDGNTQCFYYYCICEAVCAGGKANTDCPICKDDYSKCAQAVTAPEIAPLAVVNTMLDFTSGGDVNGDGYSWVSSTNTLTLSGLDLNVTSGQYALKLPADTEVVMTAGTTNTITLNTSIGGGAQAISCNGDLTIKGSGALTVNSTLMPAMAPAVGIATNSGGNITIEGGTVTANASGQASATYGINSNGTFSITGGTVTATGGMAAFNQDYIVPAGYTYWKNTSATPGGTETVSTGDATADKINRFMDKYAKIVAGGGSTEPNYTLYYNSSNGKMYKEAAFTTEVTTTDVPGWSGNGATLTLNGIDFETTAQYALVVPDGTTITVTGNSNTIKTTASGGATAIRCTGSLTINGTGSLDAASSDVDASNTAISLLSLTIEGSPNINVTTSGVYAINAYNDLNMNGGTLNVSSTGYGLKIDGNFTMTGGTIFAKGGVIAAVVAGTVPDNVVVKGKGTSDYDVDGLFYAASGNMKLTMVGAATPITDAKITLPSGADYTLYYNNGKMYKTRTGGIGSYSYSNEVTDVDGWSGDGATLTLSGINFSTTALNALVVPTGTTIALANGTTSTLTSTATGSSYGIYSTNSSLLTITGNTGILNATGNYAGISSTTVTVTGGVVTAIGGTYGISFGSTLNILGGTVTMIGNMHAFAGEGGPDNRPSVYEYWYGTTTDPANATKGTGSYSWNVGHKYVKIQSAGSGTTYTVTFNSQDGTAVAPITGIASGATVTLPTAPTKDGYYFGGWYTAADGGGTQFTASTPVTADITVYAKWTTTPTPTPTPTPSSSGSSGGGKQNTYTPAPNPWLEPNPAQTLAGDAEKGQEDSIRTKYNGTYGVRKASWQKLKGYRYYHDTMDGNAVGVRLYVDNPTALNRDMYVTGFVKGSFVDNRKAFFEKWFSNKIRVIHMDESEAWGQEVHIAAKVDLANMDTKNLYFYSYDKKTNKYTRIAAPKYWIDKNGYLHFYTELAGDIVISEGPLA